MSMAWPKKILIAFLLGVLTFTPWDILFSRLGVIEFKNPVFWGIAWWAPLGFGLMVLGSFILIDVIDRMFQFRPDYNPNHLVFEYLLITGFYLAILFFRTYPYILALSLLFVVIVRLIFFHHSLDIVYFILGACLGPTIELILSSIQLYQFTEPDFLGMPYWLPVFWGNVALALRRVTWILDPPTIVEDPYKFNLPSQ